MTMIAAPNNPLEDFYDWENEQIAASKFVFTSGDLQILRLLYEYRFLRRDHLSALTNRPAKRLHRRLLKLVQHRYLSVIRLPQQKHIYSFGREALPALIECGIAEDGLMRIRQRTQELKPLFLKHEMMIVDLHATLALALSRTKAVLSHWWEGPQLYDSVVVPAYPQSIRLPVRPDAFLAVETQISTLMMSLSHFFLEADRSTANQKRFSEKILAYWHYLEQGRHTKKFGIQSFRVVTITVTEERAANLCRLAASILPERARKYFLFGCVRRFSLSDPTPILSEMFLSPRDYFTGKRYSLLPRLKRVAEENRGA